jgi:hypothetical protein
VPEESAGGLYLTNGGQDAGLMSIASMTVAGTNVGDPRLAWPDDLYAWLVARPEYDPSDPRDVVVSGRPGVLIDADVEPEPGESIDMIGYGAPTFWLVDIPERARFIEVRLDSSSGIVVLGPAPVGDAEGYWQTLDELVATIEFR